MPFGFTRTRELSQANDTIERLRGEINAHVRDLPTRVDTAFRLRDNIEPHLNDMFVGGVDRVKGSSSNSPEFHTLGAVKLYIQVYPNGGVMSIMDALPGGLDGITIKFTIGGELTDGETAKIRDYWIRVHEKHFLGAPKIGHVDMSAPPKPVEDTNVVSMGKGAETA